MRDQVRRCGCSFKAWALPGAVGTALYELHAEKKDRKSDGQGKGNQGRRGKKPWCSGSCAIQPKASIGRRLILCVMTSGVRVCGRPESNKSSGGAHARPVTEVKNATIGRRRPIHPPSLKYQGTWFKSRPATKATGPVSRLPGREAALSSARLCTKVFINGRVEHPSEFLFPKPRLTRHTTPRLRLRFSQTGCRILRRFCEGCAVLGPAVLRS